MDEIDIRRYCPRLIGETGALGVQCGMELDVRGHCPLHGNAFEQCSRCRRWYLYPHLCRTHMLCGMCHPEEYVG